MHFLRHNRFAANKIRDRSRQRNGGDIGLFLLYNVENHYFEAVRFASPDAVLFSGRECTVAFRKARSYMFGLGRHNVAVVGTGFMAAKMAVVLNASPTVRPYAIVSRDLDRAISFGRENGFKKAYDSMETMLADNKVEMVYIATPASEHAAQVRLCIEAGKPVLCETPIALTAAEADSLFSLSSSLNVLVVEAMHIRFLPFFKQIVSVISSGAIGIPVMLTANMASDMENLPRLQRPSLGGGALGDMGYFLLNFASMIFGDKVRRIQSSCAFTSVRVDRQLSIVLQYKDDRMAVLSCTTRGNGESRAVIQGTKGYMVIEDLRNFASATVYDTRRVKTAAYKRGKQKSEFEFEMAAFAAAMKSGWKECPEIPHSQSVSMMQMMDFIRRQLGISYEEIQISQIPDMIGSADNSQSIPANKPAADKADRTGRKDKGSGSHREETTGHSSDPDSEAMEGISCEVNEEEMTVEVTAEEVSPEDLSEEITPGEEASEENTSGENVSEENVFEENVSGEDVSEKAPAEEDVSEENATAQDASEDSEEGTSGNGASEGSVSEGDSSAEHASEEDASGKDDEPEASDGAEDENIPFYLKW